ncbi:acyltransferase family protein [Paenibacillus planticolens]|uniref:Acyltransferase family protein n=1 Tax=Paenibacillus planticolens TaxID=2654976 RepID=A0ABX1ZJC3_9BACL|nr:acyltransferase [Paenibacillus planticolens]NOV00197.1 acyltransferase family protein [Paenibacillus planticolens]
MIKPLTSFRFIAALMVFFYHVGIWKAYQTGYIGVSFFFILSGFILCINYRDKFEKIDVHEIKKFYLARFAKIYPTHLLTFLLAIPYYFLIPLKHSFILYLLQAFTNVLLVHSFLPVGNFSFNGPSWSISDEFFFYAIFPFMIVLSIKKLGSGRKKISTISILWLILLMVSFLFSYYKNDAINNWLFFVFPITRAFDFLVGVTLGLLFIEIKDIIILKLTKMTFTIFEILAIVLLFVSIYFSPNMIQNIRYDLFFTPFLSLLIFTFAFQKGYISNFLSNKIFIYLGEISFSFYMIHNLVLSYTFWSLLKLSITPLTITGSLLATILLSSILYRFYEEPLRKKIRYMQKKSNTKTSTVVLPRG